jgi:hypothetical protein
MNVCASCCPMTEGMVLFTKASQLCSQSGDKIRSHYIDDDYIVRVMMILPIDGLGTSI